MTDEQRVEQLANQIATSKGIPREDAREIAERRLGYRVDAQRLRFEREMRERRVAATRRVEQPHTLALTLGGCNVPVNVAG